MMFRKPPKPVTEPFQLEAPSQAPYQVPNSMQSSSGSQYSIAEDKRKIFERKESLENDLFMLSYPQQTVMLGMQMLQLLGVEVGQDFKIPSGALKNHKVKEVLSMILDSLDRQSKGGERVLKSDKEAGYYAPEAEYRYFAHDLLSRVWNSLPEEVQKEYESPTTMADTVFQNYNDITAEVFEDLKQEYSLIDNAEPAELEDLHKTLNSYKYSPKAAERSLDLVTKSAGLGKIKVERDGNDEFKAIKLVKGRGTTVLESLSFTGNFRGNKERFVPKPLDYQSGTRAQTDTEDGMHIYDKAQYSDRKSRSAVGETVLDAVDLGVGSVFSLLNVPEAIAGAGFNRVGHFFVPSVFADPANHKNKRLIERQFYEPSEDFSPSAQLALGVGGSFAFGFGSGLLRKAGVRAAGNKYHGRQRAMLEGNVPAGEKAGHRLTSQRLGRAYDFLHKIGDASPGAHSPAPGQVHNPQQLHFVQKGTTDAQSGFVTAAETVYNPLAKGVNKLTKPIREHTPLPIGELPTLNPPVGNMEQYRSATTIIEGALDPKRASRELAQEAPDWVVGMQHVRPGDFPAYQQYTGAVADISEKMTEAGMTIKGSDFMSNAIGGVRRTKGDNLGAQLDRVETSMQKLDEVADATDLARKRTKVVRETKEADRALSREQSMLRSEIETEKSAHRALVAEAQAKRKQGKELSEIERRELRFIDADNQFTEAQKRLENAKEMDAKAIEKQAEVVVRSEGVSLNEIEILDSQNRSFIGTLAKEAGKDKAWVDSYVRRIDRATINGLDAESASEIISIMADLRQDLGVSVAQRAAHDGAIGTVANLNRLHGGITRQASAISKYNTRHAYFTELIEGKVFSSRISSAETALAKAEKRLAAASESLAKAENAGKPKADIAALEKQMDESKAKVQELKKQIEEIQEARNILKLKRDAALDGLGANSRLVKQIKADRKMKEDLQGLTRTILGKEQLAEDHAELSKALKTLMGDSELTYSDLEQIAANARRKVNHYSPNPNEMSEASHNWLKIDRAARHMQGELLDRYIASGLMSPEELTKFQGLRTVHKEVMSAYYDIQDMKRFMRVGGNKSLSEQAKFFHNLRDQVFMSSEIGFTGLLSNLHRYSIAQDVVIEGAKKGMVRVDIGQELSDAIRAAQIREFGKAGGNIDMGEFARAVHTRRKQSSVLAEAGGTDPHIVASGTLDQSRNEGARSGRLATATFNEKTDEGMLKKTVRVALGTGATSTILTQMGIDPAVSLMSATVMTALWGNPIVRKGQAMLGGKENHTYKLMVQNARFQNLRRHLTYGFTEALDKTGTNKGWKHNVHGTMMFQGGRKTLYEMAKEVVGDDDLVDDNSIAIVMAMAIGEALTGFEDDDIGIIWQLLSAGGDPARSAYNVLQSLGSGESRMDDAKSYAEKTLAIMNNRQYFGSPQSDQEISEASKALDAELQGLRPEDVEDYEKVQQITRDWALAPSHDKGFVRYGQGGTADEWNKLMVKHPEGDNAFLPMKPGNLEMIRNTWESLNSSRMNTKKAQWISHLVNKKWGTNAQLDLSDVVANPHKTIELNEITRLGSQDPKTVVNALQRMKLTEKGVALLDKAKSGDYTELLEALVNVILTDSSDLFDIDEWYDVMDNFKTAKTATSLIPEL